MTSTGELCATPAPGPADVNYSQLLEKLHSLDALTSSLESCPEPIQITQVTTWLLSILRPAPELLSPEQILEDDIISPPACLDVFRDACKLALAILSRVLPKESPPRDLLPGLVVTLVAQSDQADFWTTPESRKLALGILSDYSAQLTAPEIVIDHILKDIVKTQFSAGSPSTAHRNLTSGGRKALRPSTNKPPALLPSAPPWRHDHPETTTLLHWSICSLDSSQIEPSWHLLVPPILTLLDDYYPPSKARGCKILTTLLQGLEEQKLPRGMRPLLARTGLGPVMWDAVIPCVLALPPLTPQSHSIPLLHAAYETLIALSRSMAAGQPTQKEKAKLLDKVLRDGIFSGIRFAGENVHVAKTLVEELSIIVKEMGIWAVRHLKEMVPLLADILSNPFGITFTPLLVEAVKALRVVMRVCWPRITPYGPEVLKGIVMCWRRILEEEEGKDLEMQGMSEIKEELREAVRTLRAADDGISALEKEVIGVDPRLAGLFEV